MFYGVGSAKHGEAFATVALALAERRKRVRETRVTNTGRDNQATGACRTRSINCSMVAASLKQGITTESSGRWLVEGERLKAN